MGGLLSRYSLVAKGFVAACLLFSISGQKLEAQFTPNQQMLASYLGQNVSRVEVAGQPRFTYDKLQNAISVKPGQPLSQADVDASVNSLKHIAGISEVTLDLQPEANGVGVVFVVQPAVYVGMYQFPGATGKYSYSRLLHLANYATQAPYSNADVRRAEDSLVRFFQQDGYFEAEVHAETAIDSAHGLVNVLFSTALGRRAKVGEIRLEGATPQETAYLHKKLRSFMARLRVSALKPGMTFARYRLQNATPYMQDELTNQNYLAGTVQLVSAEYDRATNRADVTFHVETGPVVMVRATGAHIWGHTLKNLVPMYAANAADTDLINEGGRNIQLYFQNKGYFDVQVITNISNTPDGKLITYEIKKDQRHKVEEVAFKGNKHFSDKELKGHVPVQEAHFFSRGKYSDTLLRTSVKNLESTYRSAGYADAKVVPQVKRAGGNIAVTFDVTEGPLDVVEDLRIEGNKTLPDSEVAQKRASAWSGKAILTNAGE